MTIKTPSQIKCESILLKKTELSVREFANLSDHNWFVSNERGEENESTNLVS